jgi:hypothetical protein
MVRSARRHSVRGLMTQEPTPYPTALTCRGQVKGSADERMPRRLTQRRRAARSPLRLAGDGRSIAREGGTLDGDLDSSAQ